MSGNGNSNSNQRLPTTIPQRKLESFPQNYAQSVFNSFLKAPKARPNFKKVKQEPELAASSSNDTSKGRAVKVSKAGASSSGDRHGPKRRKFDQVECESMFASGLGCQRRPLTEYSGARLSGENRSHQPPVSAGLHLQSNMMSDDFTNIIDDRNKEVYDYLDSLPRCDTLPQQPEVLGRMIPTIVERKEKPRKQQEIYQNAINCATDQSGPVDLAGRGYFCVTLPQIILHSGSKEFLERARRYSYNDPRQQMELQDIMESEDNCLKRSSLPSGKLGSVRVYESGRVEMLINGVPYHCEQRQAMSNFFLVNRDKNLLNNIGFVSEHLEVMLNLNHASAASQANSVEPPASSSVDDSHR